MTDAERIERVARALVMRHPKVCRAVLGAESALDGARELASVAVNALSQSERYRADPLRETVER